MKKKNAMAWGMLLGMGVMISSCGIDMPKEVQTSFEHGGNDFLMWHRHA